MANLRLRLMAVVSVAALVPLAVLFILLVRALGQRGEANLWLVSCVRFVVGLALPIVGADLDDLVSRVRESADVLVEVMASFGLRLNLGPGMSEAVFIVPAAGARRTSRASSTARCSCHAV